MNPLIKDYPVQICSSVKWAEMDSFQHVNNAVYFRYFENVRVAYFLKLNFMQYSNSVKIAPILASISCRFKRPLTFPDTIYIGAKITQIMNDRFTMIYAIASQKLGFIAAKGESLIVCYDYKNNKKTSLPQNIIDNINNIENMS